MSSKQDETTEDFGASGFVQETAEDVVALSRDDTLARDEVEEGVVPIAAAKTTVQERLAKLAARAAEKPTFAAGDEENVDFPNGKGWFKPRRLNAAEVREYRDRRTVTRGETKLGQAAKNRQSFQVEARGSSAYTYLCSHGIAEMELVDEKGRKQAASWQKSGGTGELCNILDPAVSEWLELWLLDHNGLTDEALEELGND